MLFQQYTKKRTDVFELFLQCELLYLLIFIAVDYIINHR